MVTWYRWRRHWGDDGWLALGDHAHPIQMGVTGEVVPEGRAVRRGNQLHTILPTSVVIRLTVAPVRVSDR